MEMRELLKAINKNYSTTIFLSSHLISEIERIVTHVAIINMGEMIFQGTVEEIHNLQKKELGVNMKVDNSDAAISLLKKTYNVLEKEDGLNIVIHSKEQVSQIIQELMAHNIKVYEATIERQSLEQLFLNMTKNYTVA